MLLLRVTACAPLCGPTAVSTPLGTVTGSQVSGNVTRFTLPYAQPPVGPLRFANPQPINNFANVDARKTPPQCYQSVGVRGGNTPSEDCLYSTFYVPDGAIGAAKSKQTIPIIVWFHGGSGIGGGSTQAGLEGTHLASTQNVIVVYPQYRLSLFGWLQTNGTFDENKGGSPGGSTVAGNQAMRDAVMALQQIFTLARVFGGDPTRITIMGQSSGAIMVRALLNTPSAQSFYRNAILVSDPLNYGLSSVGDNNALGEVAMSALGCSLNDLACARNQKADDILDATYAAFNDVPANNPRINGGTPWRPMVGSFVSATGNGGAQALGGQSSSKSVIISSVQNELGSVTGTNFSPTPANATLLQILGGTNTIDLDQAANMVFNADRGSLAASDYGVYSVDDMVSDDLRMTYERLGTDGLWRCAAQNRASSMRRGGYSNVYIAEWQIGATYVSNTGNTYCTDDDRVCHEDDIYMIFGTYPTTLASSAVTSAASEMHARYASFARTDNPNAGHGTASWRAVESADSLNMLLVGINGTTSVTQSLNADACAGSLWGNTVRFDWQMYPSP